MMGARGREESDGLLQAHTSFRPVADRAPGRNEFNITTDPRPASRCAT